MKRDLKDILFAWGTPGGDDKDKQNPWGSNQGGNRGRKSDDGLDEFAKNAQDKLRGVFGSGRGSSTSSGGSGAAFGGFAVVLVAVWAITGFYQVDTAEQGVEFTFGAYTETTGPGLHWRYPWPVGSNTVVDIGKTRRVSDKSRMLTRDENVADFAIEAQYEVVNAEDYLFNVFLADHEQADRMVDERFGTVHQVLRAAMREIAGRHTFDEVFKDQRENVGPEVAVIMQGVLDGYGAGIRVIKVALRKAEAPAEVQDAFSDAIRAREDLKRSKNEAETYANKVIPESEGRASHMLASAKAYQEESIANARGEAERFKLLYAEYQKAPKVTRDRLYLDVMEKVMRANKKIMLDGKSQPLLYMPMGGDAQSNTGKHAMPAAIQSSVPAVIEQRQNHSTRGTASRQESAAREPQSR